MEQINNYVNGIYDYYDLKRDNIIYIFVNGTRKSENIIIASLNWDE